MPPARQLRCCRAPYAVLLAITSRAIRAILLASATATTLNGFEAPAAFVKKTGKPGPKISYAASNTLAKQTEASAPADVFVSADLD